MITPGRFAASARKAWTGRLALFYAVVVIVAAIVYGPAFDNSFHRDDFVYLHLASHESVLAAALRPVPNLLYYRPGAVALFHLEFSLFGFNGGGYIFFNFLLHVAVSILLIALLRRLGFAASTAVLASSLHLIGFGHYGKQVISFACTSGLMVAVLLSLVALLVGCHWLGVPSPKGRNRNTAYAWVIGFLLLIGVPFHDVSLATPVLLLLMALFYGSFKTLSRRAILFPVLAPTVSWAVILIVVVARYHTHQPLVFDLSVVDRWFRYTGFMLVPLQRPLYIGESNLDSLEVLFAFARPLQYLLASSLLLVSLWLFARGSRAVRFLVAWMYVAIFPFSFVVMYDTWLELRYVYFAAAPLCALVAYGTTRLYAGRRTLPKLAVTTALVFAFVGSTALIRFLEHKYDHLSKSAHNMDVLREMRRSTSVR